MDWTLCSTGGLGPKMHRAKTALLLKKMKTSPDFSWNEKGELKYKGDTVRGSNVMDLVNDVLRKRTGLHLFQ
jgi:hypothetical protein